MKMLVLAGSFCVLALSVSALAQDKKGKPDRIFQESPVVEKGEKVRLLSDGFKFTEGPVADPEGNVYFTDQPNDRIVRWDAETGKTEDFLKPCGRSNGLYFDRQGNLLACADEKNELWSISLKDRSCTVLIRDFKDKKLNGPNDLWVHPHGWLFFTDPFYKRPYWQHSDREQDGQHVYRYTALTGETVRVEDGIVQPNGIIGTADGKYLYVADIGDRKTYRYRVGMTGDLTDRKLFCEMGSDGMTLDSKGNLYLTGRGVTVFDPDGKKIEQIDIPEGWTANVCFGGRDGKMLMVTAMDSLYGVRMKVGGQ
ncbi:MAG: SMP-30/gluconolactonase/LRE family protein [Verrucomicrobiota bacterium]